MGDNGIFSECKDPDFPLDARGILIVVLNWRGVAWCGCALFAARRIPVPASGPASGSALIAKSVQLDT